MALQANEEFTALWLQELQQTDVPGNSLHMLCALATAHQAASCASMIMSKNLGLYPDDKLTWNPERGPVQTTFLSKGKYT